MQIRLGTFNMENLFLRWKLLDEERGSRTRKPVDKKQFIRDGGSVLMLSWDRKGFYNTTPQQRKATAHVVTGGPGRQRVKPMVLGVVEVECIEALKLFNAIHLGENRFAEACVIDGNDNREIDVGVMSDLPITVRSHQFDRTPDNRLVFARDCLEATVDAGNGKTLTVFQNHFTSKLGGAKAVARRKEQATRVAEILGARFGAGLAGNFAVMGDMNAYPDEAEMKPLMSLGLENVIDRLPKEERWTYVHKGQRQQLDYILLSKDLAAKVQGKPYIERRGLADAAYKDPAVKKFPGVGPKKTEASDHCAIFVDVDI